MRIGSQFIANKVVDCQAIFMQNCGVLMPPCNHSDNRGSYSSMPIELNKIRVCVVILNWNNWNATISCIKSLMSDGFPNLHITICDNNSGDGSFEKIKIWIESIPGFVGCAVLENSEDRSIYDSDINAIYEYEHDHDLNKAGCAFLILKTRQNYGYAKGNNLACNFVINRYNPGYILILNNDVIIKNSVVGLLVESLHNNKSYGIIGPVIRDIEGNHTIQESGRTFSRRIKLERNVQPGLSGMLKVDKIMGSCMLVRTSVFSELGGFDENYFLYYEDSDFCIRAYCLGYNTAVLFDAEIYHSRQGSSSPEIKYYYFTRNRLLFLGKHTTGLYFTVSVALHVLVYINRSILFFINEKDRSIAKAILMGLYDGITGRFGRGRFNEMKKSEIER